MDWANQLKSFLNSPLGREIVRTLKEDLHASLIQQAEGATVQETAFGLLKEAAGVIKAVNHLESVAALSDEGSKV